MALMNTQPEAEPVSTLLPVTQEDRDAAANLRMLLPPLAGGREIAAMRDGYLDDGAYVQAFAAHRLRHSPSAIEYDCSQWEIPEHRRVAEQVIRDLNAVRHSPSPAKGNWPDIGPDPFQGPRENDNVGCAHKRLRDAYAKQQPHVPNQTALVWRIDIGRVHQRLVQLEALFADRKTPATPAADTGLREALDSAIRDIEATYTAAENGKPIAISIGQFGRLGAMKASLASANASETRLRELLAAYQAFAGETAGKCLGLAMSTDHPAPDEVLMGIFEASQALAAKARAALATPSEGGAK